MPAIELPWLDDATWSEPEFQRLARSGTRVSGYERSSVLVQAIRYLSRYAPEALAEQPAEVWGVNPGHAALLEWARYFGHEVRGIEACRVDRLTQSDTLDRMVRRRQQIQIVRPLWREIIENPERYLAESKTGLVHLAGALELAYHELLITPTGRYSTHYWCLNHKFRSAMVQMFSIVAWTLKSGGSLVIHLDPCASCRAVGMALRSAADAVGGLEWVPTDSGLVQKWVKP